MLDTIQLFINSIIYQSGEKMSLKEVAFKLI